MSGPEGHDIGAVGRNAGGGDGGIDNAFRQGLTSKLPALVTPMRLRGGGG